MSSEKEIEMFSDFLLREYDNIANAFFNIKNSISLFFRYYILITSVPITVSLFFVDKKFDNNLLFGHAQDLFAAICILIAVIGVSLMMYILSMDFTATQYAQQVNGIRHYYYHIMNLDCALKDKVLVLPIDIQKPDYSIVRSIKYLLIAFSVVNAFYFALGSELFKRHINFEQLSLYMILAVILQWILCFIRVARRSGIRRSGRR